MDFTSRIYPLSLSWRAVTLSHTGTLAGNGARDRGSHGVKRVDSVMRKIRPGEEVRFQGERWVVSRIEPDRPQPYRLLRKTADGARVVCVSRDDLHKSGKYVRPA